MECFPTDECEQSNKYHPTINLCVGLYFKDTMVDELDQIQEPIQSLCILVCMKGRKLRKHISWVHERKSKE